MRLGSLGGDELDYKGNFSLALLRFDVASTTVENVENVSFVVNVVVVVSVSVVGVGVGVAPSRSALNKQRESLKAFERRKREREKETRQQKSANKVKH